MSLATLTSPSENINLSAQARSEKVLDACKLLQKYQNFQWKGQNYDLSKLIGESAKITAVVSSIDPSQKTGGTLYFRVRRLLNNLTDLGLVRITGNWSYGDMLEKPGNGVQPNSILLTLINRMQNSANLAKEIPEGWKAVVNHYLPDFAINAKSNPCKFCTRDRRDRDRATVKRVSGPCYGCKRRDSSRDSAAVAKASNVLPCGTCAFWKVTGCTTTKKQCPYRLTVCCRAARKKAAWTLRGIDGRKGKHHWMFVRKEKPDKSKIVQPALTDRLESVQAQFTNYLEDVKKRVIILRRIDKKPVNQKWTPARGKVKALIPEGNELVLDYQTRFTDESRSKEEIKKFHDTWEEAGKNFDGAVFLTLTSDPASNDSLWDVNRHFGPAWDKYLALLTKRFRAKRRDELIAVKLHEIKTLDPVRWTKLDRDHRNLQDAIDLKEKELLASQDFQLLTKRDQAYATFRIERKARPYLGLTKDEKRDVLVNLSLKTLKDGTVVKESYRPTYLSVYEFMQNGLLHAHITIFGTTWIDHIDQIKADWERLGQGSMAHAYAMTRNPATNTWEWLGGAPKDSRNRQPVDYLIKYLIKGLYTKEGHGLYWAHNKRFFTRSRSLDIGWVDYSKGESVWELVASLHEDDIPMAIKKQQRGSPLLKAWYDAHDWQGGGLVMV